MAATSTPNGITKAKAKAHANRILSTGHFVRGQEVWVTCKCGDRVTTELPTFQPNAHKQMGQVLTDHIYYDCTAA